MTNTDKYQSQLSLAPQFQPSKTLLENWKLWLAHEVVTQLKKFQEVRLELNSICSELGIIDSRNQVFSTFNKHFSQKVLSLKSKLLTLEEVNSCRLELEQFYSQVVFKHLQKVEQDWQKRTTQRLQEFLSKDISRASPIRLIKFLKDLIGVFVFQRNIQEKQKIYNLAIEESATRAFKNIYELSDRDSMWNAVVVIFESKLLKDVYSICSQIYFNLVQLCQSYCQLSRRSLLMLEKVEASIEAKCSIDLVSVPVFTLLKKIDIEHQLNLIELWMGHGINYWGNTPVSWQQLETKLLQNIEYPAQELYLDFRACFMQNINLHEDLN